jgi:hypothetical protein
MAQRSILLQFRCVVNKNVLKQAIAIFMEESFMTRCADFGALHRRKALESRRFRMDPQDAEGDLFQMNADFCRRFPMPRHGLLEQLRAGPAPGSA